MHRLRDGPRQDPFLEASPVSLGEPSADKPRRRGAKRVVPMTKGYWDSVPWMSLQRNEASRVGLGDAASGGR